MLQLIGLTSLFIASKYEEVYHPELRDIVYASKGNCNTADIIKTESEILVKLDFDLMIVSPLLIRDRLFFISSSSNEDYISEGMNKVYFFSSFILELCLLEYLMLQFPPSVLAASSIFVSRKLFMLKPSWPLIFMSYNLCETTVVQCSKIILSLLKQERKSTIIVLKKKYSKLRYQNVYNLITSTQQIAHNTQVESPVALQTKRPINFMLNMHKSSLNLQKPSA